MWRARVRRVPAGASAPCHRARCCWQGGREARAPQLRAAGTQRTEKPSQKRAENGKGYPEKKLKTVLVGRVFLFLGLFVCFFFVRCACCTSDLTRVFFASSFPRAFRVASVFFFLPYRNAFCKYIPAPFFVFFFVCLFVLNLFFYFFNWRPNT